MRGPRPEHFDTNPSTLNAGVHPPPTYPTGARKKGVGVRPWLVLHSSGQTTMTETGKHNIMRQTGLPGRDLRVLDPLLSYPSTVLGRERAIVMSMEHVKAIITAQEVFLFNSKDPSVSPFTEELKKRILCHCNATKHQEEDNSEGETHTRMDPSQGEAQLFGDERDAKQSLENQDGSKVLPFEFVALEACLEAATSSLESEAMRLELEAHPAMDKLTSKISTLNLEQVRQIKSRLDAITGRVQKVRYELEHLLDNDEDMAKMYLTDKLAHKLENSSALSFNESDTIEVSLSRETHSAMTNKFDVKELEMLLEPYFVQIDGTLNKLSTLREYVDDTDEYINIMLAGKQNNLLQMGVKLVAATLVMSLFIAVAGVFGMNINIELFNDDVAGPGRFMWTVIGGFVGSIFLYVGSIGWCKHKRLLD